jgi:deoxyribodipyrimidine photo-lyase
VVKKERITILKNTGSNDGPVIYWMSRDQRKDDNWAMVFSQDLAMSLNQPLAVVFCLSGNFPGANLRHYDFMIKGLREVFSDLRKKNIPLYLLKGNPPETLDSFIKQFNIRHVVTDFDPLQVKQQWKKILVENTQVNLYEADSHNIVPCVAVSQKTEFGAYTIRPKIKKLLYSFLDEFPSIQTQKKLGSFEIREPDWKSAMNFLLPDNSVQPVNWLKPGSSAARVALNTFLNTKLNSYHEMRNDPNEDGCSNLSPYLHFGQISAQRIALEIIKKFPGNPNTESFLEELIIRRELSDNYCYYNPEYDSFNGFPDWARKTLDDHRVDEREYLYEPEIFDRAETHDRLWNAAQMEMVKSGKMHGYMRMYWAKKILEWSASPEEALKIAILLNDQYQLDGRDPNGYTGCAWSIGGVHDRAWSERPVFGKIRYMNYNGCKRKFDVEKYIQKWL